MTVSNKADRKALPAPKGPRFVGGGSSSFVAPRSDTEQALARALAEIMKVDRVSVDDNFFNDLGAHSLLMAGFCSAIRRNTGMPNVAMKDIYLNPTIAKLAAHLKVSDSEPVEQTRAPFRIPTDFEYFGCGALQLAFYAGYGAFLLWLFLVGFFWCYEAIDSPVDTYLRIIAYTFAMFVLLNAIPIAAKWCLVGRWKAEVFPIWGLRYFRFWLIKSLVQNAPVIVFAGSPLYNLYLRLLGARIGSNTVIRCRSLPVCTDLVSIGANTILRTDFGPDLLQGARQLHPYRTGAHRRRRHRRRVRACSIPIRAWRTVHSSATHPICGAARLCPRASAITALRARRQPPTSASSRAGIAQPCGASSTRRCR